MYISMAELSRRTWFAHDIRERYRTCHHANAHRATSLRSWESDSYLRDVASALLRLLGQEGRSLCKSTKDKKASMSHRTNSL
jgi:hypothetical protein